MKALRGPVVIAADSAICFLQDWTEEGNNSIRKQESLKENVSCSVI
jgi:hypothetical protein